MGTMARGKWCLVCDAWIANNQPAEPCLSKADKVENYWKLHEASKDHLKKMEMSGVCNDVKWDGHTIIASVAPGYRSLTYHEMCYAMRKYGYTTKLFDHENDTYAVSYRDQASAEIALGENICYNGIPIKTRPMFLIDPKQHKAHKLEDVQLDPNVAWEVQAKQLAVALRLAVTPEVAREHQRQTDHVLTDIASTIRPLCKLADFYIYGSRATGLADLDSDIDIHINLETAGCDYEKPLSKEEHDQLLKQVTKMFRRKPFMFSGIFSVAAARVPVLHFLHIPTKIECDITFKNMLGVYNSQFLKFIASQDERIFYLFFVIKRWRKQHDLKISNYCLTMLAIYFLQTLPQPMLPPILQLKGDSQKLVINEGWVCSYTSNRITNENKSTLKELVVAFFKFLALLDFGVDVICPLTASAVEKWKFLQHETLPEAMQCLSQLDESNCFLVKKTVCVQDPFELNHNIAKGLVLKHLMEIITLVNKLIEHCDHTANLTLKDLVMFAPSSKSPKHHTKFSHRIYLHNYFPSYESLKHHTIQELWFSDAVNVIHDIFTKVLNCAESSHQSEPGCPPRKIQRLPSESELLGTWPFCTPTVLFNGRKKHRVNIEACHFIKEVMTSKVMLEKFYKDVGNIHKEFQVVFKLELSSHVNPTYIDVCLTNMGTAPNTFHLLCRFVEQELQNIVDKSMQTQYREVLETLERQFSTLEEQLNYLSPKKPIQQATVSDTPNQTGFAAAKPVLDNSPNSANSFLNVIENVNLLPK